MSDKSDALSYHLGDRPGKIEVVPTKPLNTQNDLALAYSPGVAHPCMAIYDDPDQAFAYTAKGNLVAVVTNGTAVLGLGDIGPLAGKPVMEGKANLFKKFADIDVFDIELDAQTTDEIVAAVKAMAPTFGGINLEDIRAPECFEVERRLQEDLDIPVFHDDQHGTAIISAAALLNACELTGRSINEAKIVFSGAGAAAIACAQLYVELGAKKKNIIMSDRQGVVRKDRDDLFTEKAAFATDEDHNTLQDAMVNADVFIGLSVGNVVTPEMLLSMERNPIVFAMANPDPEINYALARETRADAILATGRSDTPNQVNNVLGFPFVFRGALDCRARKVNMEMKLAAAYALAELAKEDVPDRVLLAYNAEDIHFGREYIIPKPFDPRVLLRVAPAVAAAAAASGVARRPIEDLDAYEEHLHRLVERSRGLMLPLIRRAQHARKRRRIAFTDGENHRVIRAAQQLADTNICTPVLVGNPDTIAAIAQERGLSLSGVAIEPHEMGERSSGLAEAFWSLRRRKGVTLEGAKALMADTAYFGAMLVREGHADGLIGGPSRSYRHTVRPALQALGTEKKDTRVSGVYVMLGKEQRLFIGDCTVNVEPDAETLAEIALNTARVAESFGEVPRVAMLSYSDFGEHRSDDRVQVVRRAMKIVRQRRPNLIIDGEMQADTAVNPDKLNAAFPFADLDKAANVLIFPDLTSGNICYKLMGELTAVETVGPLLVGIQAPVNVAPINSSVADIVNVATYTVHQAMSRRRKKKS
jgi:malate dehydrogenase (oxaloacetate-decarboxylating)(NADP+)